MSDLRLQITVNGTSRQMPIGDDPVSIGRQIGNTLVIDDNEASRFHCIIERAAAGYRVRDLGSRNGTKVNGEIIKTALLDESDTVTIGRVELKIVSAASLASSKAKASMNTMSISGSYGKTNSGGARANPPAISASDEEWLPDLVDDDFDASHAPTSYESPAGGHGPLIDESAPPADSLTRMADALPEQSFGQNAIALLNARGVTAFAAGPAKKGEQPAEAVTLLRLLLLVCYRTRASDIHIEPKNEIYLVRVRIDGGMVDAAKLKKEVGVKLCAVIKILSDIDIAQRNIVQEGHFTSRVPDRRVDYRVSFTPAMYGQKCVIRVLDAANSPRYLWDLGLPEWMFKELDRTIRGDSGMLLVCGPTGSGKTASLYSTLRSIDAGERNVITIEDPVEIQIEGITQMPVKEEQGNTFPALLRSVLRQDPDVILVGEIRDGETAKTALQAANTGHLVLSTVHSRDTVGTISRLVDLGVEWYQVSAALQIVMAQRLVRQICPHCKVGVKPNLEQATKLQAATGKPIGRIYRSAGCPRCLNTGFAGRRAIFELLVINDDLREVLQRNPLPVDIHKALQGTKFMKLIQSGYQLVAEGLTTMDEVERVVGV